MAYKNDTTLEKIGDNEPIFVLRAQDRYAPDAVAAWASLAERGGAPPGKITEALNCAQAMKEWQRSHGSKVPD